MAVVVPIVAVALIALAGLWLWRRRKQRHDAAEMRRKEVEEYGFNPNDGPSLPVLAGGRTADGSYPMTEDVSGYRGWGSTAAGSSAGRKPSTTLGASSVAGGAIAGRAYSDPNSASPGAPVSDGHSGDHLVAGGNGHANSDDSEPLGAMGPAASGNRGNGINREASNASSHYSAAGRSDASGDPPVPGGAYGAAQYYSSDGPYADHYGSGGPAEVSGQPVIRDNMARRATRIENPSHFAPQASAGISQNF